MRSELRSGTLIALAAVVPLAGCASMNNTQRGAVIGATSGAVIGGVIGNNNGSTAKGAILGAAVGGAAGAIIGSQMDRQRAELAAKLEGAKVERVGEGLLVTFDTGLLFDFDSDVVKGAAQQNLAELARSVREYPNTELLIVGHTDAVGSDSYNQGLSERRAASAARFLATEGADAARIKTAGRGETEPVASNDDDWGRSQNRRVEVAIFASQEYRERLIRQNGGG